MPTHGGTLSKCERERGSSRAVPLPLISALPGRLEQLHRARGTMMADEVIIGIATALSWAEGKSQPIDSSRVSWDVWRQAISIANMTRA